MLFLTGFFTVSVEIDNSRLILALTITTGASITVANNLIEMLLFVTDKTINDLRKESKKSNGFTKPFNH